MDLYVSQETSLTRTLRCTKLEAKTNVEEQAKLKVCQEVSPPLMAWRAAWRAARENLHISFFPAKNNTKYVIVLLE